MNLEGTKWISTKALTFLAMVSASLAVKNNFSLHGGKTWALVLLIYILLEVVARQFWSSNDME